MEIVVNKEDLQKKIVEIFNNNLLANLEQNSITDETEVKAHQVVNKKRFDQEAANIANLVFTAYGVTE